MDPSIRLFGTLDVQGGDQILLLAEEDGETLGELDPFTIADCAVLLLDDNINLMWRAPNVQHDIRCLATESRHQPIEMPGIRILAIGRHGNHLGTPRCVHRIQELDEQVEGVEGRVALEHRYRGEMQIEEDPTKTDADAHVKEVLAAVRVAITG